MMSAFRVTAMGRKVPKPIPATLYKLAAELLPLVHKEWTVQEYETKVLLMEAAFFCMPSSAWAAAV